MCSAKAILSKSAQGLDEGLNFSTFVHFTLAEWRAVDNTGLEAEWSWLGRGIEHRYGRLGCAH
jgi:hypothetical protein